MKHKFVYIFIAIAIILIIINATQLDFYNLLEGDSLIGLIGIVISLCVILILLIFKTSKKIEDKFKNQK